jgi:hypothetical protein
MIIKKLFFLQPNSYQEFYNCSLWASLRGFAGLMWPAGQTLPRPDLRYLKLILIFISIELKNCNFYLYTLFNKFILTASYCFYATIFLAKCNAVLGKFKTA